MAAGDLAASTQSGRQEGYDLTSSTDHENVESKEVRRESGKGGLSGKPLREPIVATAKIPPRPHNQYFSVPEAVKGYFTGRGTLLEGLGRTLDDDPSQEYRAQKRFVVQGLGGSGKTQFCCKFAELNRQK